MLKAPGGFLQEFQEERVVGTGLEVATVVDVLLELPHVMHGGVEGVLRGSPLLDRLGLLVLRAFAQKGVLEGVELPCGERGDDVPLFFVVVPGQFDDVPRRGGQGRFLALNIRGPEHLRHARPVAKAALLPLQSGGSRPVRANQRPGDCE